MVEVRGVGKRFGRVWALRDVSLTVPRGVICGLLGVNGAGKSTLLRILAGVQRPTEGEVRIGGHRPGRVTKARVAFVPEIDHLYRWMDVQDALNFSATFFEDFNHDRARELLRLMQLEPSSSISSLSRGFRARLKLVLALARDADGAFLPVALLYSFWRVFLRIVSIWVRSAWRLFTGAAILGIWMYSWRLLDFFGRSYTCTLTVPWPGGLLVRGDDVTLCFVSLPLVPVVVALAVALVLFWLTGRLVERHVEV